MNKGTVSDIKPGMLVQIEVSSGPDKGIVYRADTDNFNVLILDNSGENLPACIGADEIICAWDVSQLPTYVLGDLLICGEHTSFRSAIENSIVYGNYKAEKLELTLEEISEIVSKYIGKSVSVSVKESESGESESDKTEDETDDCSETVRVEVAVGECITRDGVTYRCVKDRSQRVAYWNGCDGCDLGDKLCSDLECSAACREDGISVHFVKVSDT